MSLIAKTIMVMGANGRIGQVLVQKLLQSGAQVLAVDKCMPSLEPSESLLCLTADLTDSATLDMLFAEGLSRFGSFDGAVNTAYPRNEQYGKPLLEVRYEDFCENLSLHLGGYFLFMQHCLRYALDSQVLFSLVNLSSIYGSMAPRFELYQDTTMTMPVEYAAIKSGLEHLVRYVTAFAMNTSFRVNCVSPGGILDQQNPLFLNRYRRFCRSKGMLDPQDIMGAILFLLDEDSQYICGQTIMVDDGFHL